MKSYRFILLSSFFMLLVSACIDLDDSLVENDGIEHSLAELCEMACDKIYNECGYYLVAENGAALQEQTCARRCVEDSEFEGEERCLANSSCEGDLAEMRAACPEEDEIEENQDNQGNQENQGLGGELTEEERALFDAINAYRVDEGLPAVPLSYSLTVVARAHVQDLIDHGQSVLVGECNLHSWSDQGPWSPCCYTSDHAQASCMWDKPGELTNYPGPGYEISVMGVVTASAALTAWQGSPGHNAVILSEGIWADHPWQAMGVGIEGGFSHVWFGTMVDPDGF